MVDPVSVTTVATGLEVAKGLQEVNKLKDTILNSFKEGNPEIKTLTINYPSARAEINFAVNLPKRKKFSKKIPLTSPQEFKLVSIMDTNFRIVKEKVCYWDGSKYVFDISKLASKDDRFLITMEGKADRELIKKIVETKTSQVPKPEGENELYMLEAALRQRSILRS